MNKLQHLVIILRNLEGGGIERVNLLLLQALKQNYSNLQITLILLETQGVYLSHIPSGIEVIYLNVNYEFRLNCLRQVIVPLVKGLRRQQPTVILCSLACFNSLGVIARWLAGLNSRLVLVEHTLPLHRLFVKEGNHDRWGLLTGLTLQLMKWLYPWADSVIAVAHDLAQELEQTAGLRPPKLQVIYNPVVNETLLQQSQEPIDHPWFAPGQPPVFLAVGRLTSQKDYPTLIRAFGKFYQQLRLQYQSARLLILGEGEARSSLQALIQLLQLDDVVEMPGFTPNPYHYLRKAQALILSSKWEVLPTVLIEALACGCPVIATDCDHGPREILAQGRYGTLIPVGDVDALALAMADVLSTSSDRASLQAYAQTFSVQAALDRYATVLGLTPPLAGLP